MTTAQTPESLEAQRPPSTPSRAIASPDRGAANGDVPRARVETSVERVGWSLAALVVVFWGLALWNGSSVAAWFNLAGIGLVLAGLLAIWRVWASAQPPKRSEQALIMVLVAAGLLAWGYLQVLLAPGYGTDSVAFNQYAAELLLDGRNPYGHSMLPALDRFLVPTIYHTYLLDGTPVESLSYPALAFLLYVPALALGLSMQAAIFTDLAAWALACLLLWRLFPQRCAWAAALIMSFAVYTSFVAGGVTDALFLPFVLLAVWRWDRFGDPAEPGASRWLGPIALGLDGDQAASLVSVPVSPRRPCVGGAFTILGGVALIGAIALHALHYPRFKRAWVPLVGLIFFWPTRSFASYLISLVPAAVLAGATVRPALDRVPRLVAGARKPALLGIGGVFAVFATLAVAARPPLEISILSTRSTGQLGSVSRIDVRVTNTSDAAVRPHFTVSTAGRLTTFWYPLAGT